MRLSVCIHYNYAKLTDYIYQHYSYCTCLRLGWIFSLDIDRSNWSHCVQWWWVVVWTPPCHLVHTAVVNSVWGWSKYTKETFTQCCDKSHESESFFSFYTTLINKHHVVVEILCKYNSTYHTCSLSVLICGCIYGSGLTLFSSIRPIHIRLYYRPVTIDAVTACIFWAVNFCGYYLLEFINFGTVSRWIFYLKKPLRVHNRERESYHELFDNTCFWLTKH